MTTLASVARQSAASSSGAVQCRRKFLRFFPAGFHDEKYIAWERGYKWAAHEQWSQLLSKEQFQEFLRLGKHAEIAARVVRIESRTNLLFSFEKMALRDAVKSPQGAKLFATGLFDFLYGNSGKASAGKGGHRYLQETFERWVDLVGSLPRRQTRVLTWPVVTVFGFLAQPATHLFLKPMVTRRAAEAYGLSFEYHSHVSWQTYASLLSLAHTVKKDLRDLHPKDLIDIQSFLWVLGSEEYD